MAKDKRVNNGGVREGSGRKPKATELELIEKLSPFDDDALRSLEKGVKAGEFPFIKLFFEYRFGKPKESIDHTSGGDKINAIFNIGYSEEPENEA